MDPRQTEELGSPQQHRVTRDDARDLAFDGWPLGEGHHGSGGTSGYECDWTRGVRVRIYLTTGGRLVTAVHRWSRWQGEPERHAAAAHDDAPAVLAWLVEDAGRLGAASKAAWEEACATWPPLDGLDVEEVGQPPIIPPGLTWHVPPERQGQIVEVAFALDGEDIYRRVTDTAYPHGHPGRVHYARAAWPADIERIEPWTEDPPPLDWTPMP